MKIPSATRPEWRPQLDKRSDACFCLKEEVTQIKSRFKSQHESDDGDNFGFLPLLTIHVRFLSMQLCFMIYQFSALVSGKINQIQGKGINIVHRD